MQRPRRIRDRVVHRGDCGSGTVLALAVVAVVVTIGLAVVALGAGLAGRQRIVAAADAAALAAADAASGAVPGVPCELAAHMASVHGAAVADCRIDGAEAVVVVAGPVLGVTVTASARAGPPDVAAEDFRASSPKAPTVDHVQTESRAQGDHVHRP